MWLTGTALLAAVLVGTLQSQLSEAGWSQTLAAGTLAALLVLLGAWVARLGLHGSSVADGQMPPGSGPASEWVATEIGYTRELGKVVQIQLGSVVQETEKAAYNITSRLADIDGKVTSLDNMVATSIVDVGLLAADSAQEIDSNRELIDAMNSYIQFRMQESESDRTRVTQMIAQAKSLSGLVDMIKVIAQQTNLLSLNAAIEAARVGSQGKGFAVVAGEVRMLSRETEKAVNQINHGISSVTQSINELFQHKIDDDKINQERETLNRFSLQLKQLNQKYGELITAQTQVALTMGGNSRELKELFMDAMSSVQFQDITRQQIERIVSTLERMDEHFGQLAESLRRNEHGAPEQSIQVHIAEIFDSYVMESQRADHQSVTAGADTPRTSATPAVAAGPAVELF